MTTVAEQYRVQDDGRTVRRPSLERVVEQWLAAKAVAEEAEKEEYRLACTIRASIGTASYAVVSEDITLSYKLQRREGHWVDATEFRVLRKVKAAK